MTDTGITTGGTEDRHLALARYTDAGLEPPRELLIPVRAQYLLSLRETFQKAGPIKDRIVAADPATSALEDIVAATCEMAREGTEAVHREAVLFLLAELDELRKGGDIAYVVDTQTGEIVAPIVEGIVLRPDPFVDEQGVTRIPEPILNPEVAAQLALARAAATRADDIRRKSSDPVRGRAYRHLTEPERILELAAMKLEERGLSREELEDVPDEILTFGVESEEADLQSTNPSYHRLWVYSSSLASQVMQRAGEGGKFRLGALSMERNGEMRWYEVRLRARRA